MSKHTSTPAHTIAGSVPLSKRFFVLIVLLLLAVLVYICMYSFLNVQNKSSQVRESQVTSTSTLRTYSNEHISFQYPINWHMEDKANEVMFSGRSGVYMSLSTSSIPAKLTTPSIKNITEADIAAKKKGHKRMPSASLVPEIGSILIVFAGAVATLVGVIRAATAKHYRMNGKWKFVVKPDIFMAPQFMNSPSNFNLSKDSLNRPPNRFMPMPFPKKKKTAK